MTKILAIALDFIDRLFTRGKNLITKLHLINDYYRKNRIDYFHYRISILNINAKPRFGGGFSGGSNLFYQTHPKLNLLGQRPTLSRLNTYNLLKYCNKSMTAVDLGSNIGFFSLYLSEHLKEILLVEFNEYLSNMARMTADYLAINNVTFLDDSIETVFLSNVKYDLVLALAIHQYLDLDRSEVLSSLVKKTNSGGFILIESHPEDNFIDYILGEIELFNLSVLEYGPIDDQGGRIRTFILLKLGKEYE